MPPSLNKAFDELIVVNYHPTLKRSMAGLKNRGNALDKKL